MTAWRPFVVALALPLVFTAATLVAVARNRAAVAREVVLTERDISLDAGSDPNAGTRIWVSWSDGAATRPWVTCATLASVGFACGVDPQSPAADRYYARQLPRYAFVAFSVDGSRPSRSRLVPMDVSRDAGALARRYPPSAAVIVPAVVAIARFAPLDGPPFVTGVVVSLDPRSIQVPTSLRTAIPARARQGITPPMDLQIRYGRRWEPWVTAIRPR